MNKQKIKVLFLVGNLRPANGVTSFVMSYFRNINHDRFEIDFALLNDVETPYYSEILNAGSKIFILPSLRNIGEHLKKCKQILDNNYQIIHDNIVLSSLPMMYCAYKYRVPVRILQSHNTELSSIKWKEKRNRLFLPLLKKFSNTYFACGNDAGRAMFGDSSFNVIPNAIPFSKKFFDDDVRDFVREKYNCHDKVVVGTVGRLSQQKNPFFAMKVIQSLTKMIPNLQYWWIGSGELDGQVQKYINENKLDNYIKLFGSRDDVSQLYQAMDAFFLPSLFEGLPITAIEAQAAGLPCVISDSVTKELVYTDLVEFISLNSDLTSWNEALCKQLRRKPRRDQYIERLKDSPFYSSNASKLLEKYYSELLGEMVNE